MAEASSSLRQFDRREDFAKLFLEALHQFSRCLIEDDTDLVRDELRAHIIEDRESGSGRREGHFILLYCLFNG